ncbi:MAG TPA: PDZ domain-containing protein [Gemmatimonadaceae bacterium]
MSRSSRLAFVLGAAVALALTVPGVRASAQGSVCAACDSTQRAELARTLRGQLSEVQAELMRLRPELEKLSADLAAGEPMNAARISIVVRENELRGIETQLERALARLDRQQRRVRMETGETKPKVRVVQTPRSAERVRAEPAGYIGVSFSGAIEPRPGNRRFFFHDYPQIVAVDAGSPAERGGLQAGDVLVMLGDTELRGRGVDLEVVLRPGAKVPVRYRRDGSTHSATLVVAKRPTAVRADPAAPFFPPAPARAPRPERTAVTAVTPRTPELPVPAAAPLPPTFISGGMTGGVAGAEVAHVQGNLREMLGVDGGLLVLDVGMGTPASRSGLRAGDVIQRADGRALRTPMDLVRAVREASGSAVRLEIVRKQEKQTLVLRW